MSRLTFRRLPARMAALALLWLAALNGCVSPYTSIRSTELGTMRQTTLAYVPVDIMHLRDVPRGQPPGFITLEISKRLGLYIARYDTALRLVWSQPVDSAMAEAERKLEQANRYSRETLPIELPIAFYTQDTRAVVLSQRRSEGAQQNLYIYARTFSLSSGTLTSMQTLDTVLLANTHEDNSVRVHADFSEDSTYVLLYYSTNRANADRTFLKLALFQSDLKLVARRSVLMENTRDIPRARVENLGDVLLISHRRPDTVRIERVSFAGGRPNAVLAFRFPGSTAAEPSFGGYVADFDENRLTVMAPLADDDNLVGIGTAHINASELTVTDSHTHPITKSDLLAAFDSEELESPWLGPVWGNGRGSDPPYHVVIGGSQQLMVIALSEAGKSVWHKGFWHVEGGELLGCRTTRHETLRLLYTHHGDIYMKEYRLSDGALMRDQDLPLITVSGALTMLSQSLLWLDDDTFVLAGARHYVIGGAVGDLCWFRLKE